MFKLFVDLLNVRNHLFYSQPLFSILLVVFTCKSHKLWVPVVFEEEIKSPDLVDSESTKAIIFGLFFPQRANFVFMVGNCVFDFAADQKI